MPLFEGVAGQGVTSSSAQVGQHSDLMDEVGAVSYTHLDVYKRQVVWWVGMLAFTGALVASHVPRRRGSIPLGPFLFASYVVVATVLGGS